MLSAQMAAQRMMMIAIIITLHSASMSVAAETHSACHADQSISWGETISWDSKTGPAAREHAVMLYDGAFDRIIVFGGTGYNPQLSPLTDAWEFKFENKQWRQLKVTGDAPTLGGSRRATKLDNYGRSLVFGGYDTTQQPLDNLLELQVTENTLMFKKIQQVNTLPARFLHAFIKGREQNSFYAFGGVGSQFFNDTWRLNIKNSVGTWTEIETQLKPSPRYGFSFFVDDSANTMVIVGGADERFPSENPSDIWRLSLGATNEWEKISDVDYGHAEIGRRNPQFSFSHSQSQLLLHGGTSDGRTASADNGFLKFDEDKVTWISLPEGGPESRASGMSIFDPIRNTHWMGFGNATKRYQDLTPLFSCTHK